MHLRKIFAAIITINLAFSAAAFAATAPQNLQSGLEYEVVSKWQLDQPPLDIVHSLDGKYVFILTSEQQVLVYSAQGKLEGSIPVESGVTAIDIAPRAELLYLIDSDKKSFTTISVSFVRNINTSGSPYKGPADAPVTMVLFTDFECPYCKKVEPLLAQVLERNPKTVKLVFKNMPLQFHKFARPAAIAALAAEEQGKFWEFHDELFALEKLSNKAIEGVAVKLGLDIEKWKKDMTSPEVNRKLNIDIQDAQKAGVTGTPTVYINGRLLKNRSLEGFQKIINEELKKQ